MLTRIALISLVIAFHCKAEDVTVYQCLSGGDKTVSLGNQLSTISTGTKSLQAIYNDHLKTSWIAEPFYGPVVKYVFKDSAGKLFVVHFEFEEGDKIIGKGIRFAIAPLKAVNVPKGHFTGSPYNGSSVTDETILKQLRELARKK